MSDSQEPTRSWGPSDRDPARSPERADGREAPERADGREAPERGGERPAEQSAEQPTEKPGEQPPRQPPERPEAAEQPADGRADQPTEQTAQFDRPTEQTAQFDRPAEQPAERPFEHEQPRAWTGYGAVHGGQPEQHDQQSYGAAYGYPGYQGYPQYYGAPYPVHPQYGQPEPPRSRPPTWMWPLIAGLALVLGIAGGAIGGVLVSDQGGDTPGGVLKVQRRTAPPLPANNRSIAAVANKVLPSTVQIVAEYKGDPRGATGSGWVFDKQGHVITNNHVVAEAAGDGGPIDVIDQAGRHHSAHVVGRSPVYDIAVLRVDGAKKFKPLAIGSADQMRVGETVVAVGSPLGLSATVTSGIISAVDRPVTTGDNGDNSYINALQTDAAINPGNSGGPLVNLRGQVIGVNSAIASLGVSGPNDESGNIGVGFAIPIEQVEVTTDQILRTGHAEYPVIGATVRGTSDMNGAVVDSIAPGEPASRTDLRPGDRITAVDGHKIKGSIDLVVAIRTHVPGESVTLTFRRDGTTHHVKVKLDAKRG